MKVALRKHSWLFALVLVVAAAMTWYFASPWYTLHDLREAAKANDVDRMSAHIDYPALREDLKSELMARMMIEMQKDKSGFGGLGMAIGSAMMGPLIDGFVSPAGLRAAFVAEKAKTSREKQPGGNAFNLTDKVEVIHHGLDRFDVKSGGRSDGILVFKRYGLGWKLSGIDLPPAEPSTDAR